MTLKSLVPITHSDAHCAFTDLAFFAGHWWCAFRQAEHHMSYDGVICIMHSDNAQDWQVAAQLSWQGGDLRDPHFVVNPQGRLVLNAGIRRAIRVESGCNFYSVGWVYDGESRSWSEPVLDELSDCRWRWMPFAHQEQVYSVAYTGQDRRGALYRSADGLHWQTWQRPFFPDAEIYSNEASLAYQDGRMWCLLRRDQKGGCAARLGWAFPPFKDWQWQTLNQSLTGQKLFTTSQGDLLAVYRVIDYEQETARVELGRIDSHRSEVVPLLVLPSEGDCSYAGVVEQNHQLYISFYSTPEDQTSQVFIAQVDLNELSAPSS